MFVRRHVLCELSKYKHKAKLNLIGLNIVLLGESSMLLQNFYTTDN